MKQKNDAGFSLVEVLVAIVILAAFVVPTCSALVMSARMNAKTDALMQAQLDVSSAIEMLMAKGIVEETVDDNGKKSPKGLTTENPKYDPDEDQEGNLEDVPEKNSEDDREEDLDSNKQYYYDVAFERLREVQYPDLQRSIDNDYFSVNVFWIATKNEAGNFYDVTVISRDGLVKVDTSIRIGG